TFPSLHVLITCILLDHDSRHVRWRFWTMVIPALGLLISTIYLRYHYGVDVLVAFVLFLVLRTTFLKVERREVRLSERQATI
ncbi:MAG TPA: phosphatase PAP2 family protein, partial [Candidatus Binatia bacterium]|nr:phosphatase PAP2 family protein [Candidatus Binatia bacterium]